MTTRSTSLRFFAITACAIGAWGCTTVNNYYYGTSGNAAAQTTTTTLGRQTAINGSCDCNCDHAFTYHQPTYYPTTNNGAWCGTPWFSAPWYGGGRYGVSTGWGVYYPQGTRSDGSAQQSGQNGNGGGVTDNARGVDVGDARRGTRRGEHSVYDGSDLGDPVVAIDTIKPRGTRSTGRPVGTMADPIYGGNSVESGNYDNGDIQQSDGRRRRKLPNTDDIDAPDPGPIGVRGRTTLPNTGDRIEPSDTRTAAPAATPISRQRQSRTQRSVPVSVRQTEPVSTSASTSAPQPTSASVSAPKPAPASTSAPKPAPASTSAPKPAPASTSAPKPKPTSTSSTR